MGFTIHPPASREPAVTAETPQERSAADAGAFDTLRAQADVRPAASTPAPPPGGMIRAAASRLFELIPRRPDPAGAAGKRPDMAALSAHVASEGFQPDQGFFKKGSVFHAIARSPDTERGAARATLFAAARRGAPMAVEAGDRRGEAPLTTAVRKGNADAAAILREMGASPHLVDGTGTSPMRIARATLAETEVAMRFNGRPLHPVPAEARDETTRNHLAARRMVDLLEQAPPPPNPGASPPRSILKTSDAAPRPPRAVRFADDR
ncbi:hypothetical protein [Rhizosaccharibacter radicis]|uniref:Ankyrin repeat domain-containing protein n=1 Tax=Rhizosaccharibacter radicis TaxID=2782605 RepID=A0ABT1W1I0_9PROT|nr:hypothetical protein [Acetobacteraceae bacterium KSS12]